MAMLGVEVGIWFCINMVLGIEARVLVFLRAPCHFSTKSDAYKFLVSNW